MIAWGIDPGTSNAGLCRIGPGPDDLTVVDIRRSASRTKPPHLVVRAWTNGLPLFDRTAPPDGMVNAAIAALRDLDPGPADVIVCERVLGRVHHDLSATAGELRGVLRTLSGAETVAWVAASTWRKRLLGIDGRTKAGVAERIARDAARAHPLWPAKASPHAAEARWIAAFAHLLV